MCFEDNLASLLHFASVNLLGSNIYHNILLLYTLVTIILIDGDILQGVGVHILDCLRQKSGFDISDFNKSCLNSINR